jgi:hypothetical protein
MTEIVEYNQSDRDKVASWRLHQLIEAGYPVQLAERLAHSDADLHRAIALVRQGCEAKVAAEILL